LERPSYKKNRWLVSIKNSKKKPAELVEDDDEDGNEKNKKHDTNLACLVWLYVHEPGSG
jgi:hypothetical protein